MPRAWLRRQAFRLLVVAAAVALAVALVDLVRFGSGAFTTSYVVRWGLREVALLGAAFALGRRPGGVARLAATASLAGAGLLTVSIGHFGLRGGATWVITSTAHLLAALLWAGSVAALALLGVRSARLGLSHGDVRTVLRGFRVPATVSVVVVAVSGIYLASDVVVSVDAVLLTTYGRVLLAKVALAGLVGLVALVTTRLLHARRVQERAARGPLVGVEAVGLLVVVALAGLLATGQPAVSPRLVTEEAPSVIDDRPVADLQQTLALRPNRPGASVALIDVLDTRRPAPGPVTGVSLTVRDVSSGGGGAPTTSGATTVAATAVSPSRWSAALVLPSSGPVDLDVVVHRRGVDDVHSTVRWVVGQSSSDPATVVSRAPVSDLLAWTSGALAVAAALGALLLLRRRHARAVPPRGRMRRAGEADDPAPAPRDPAVATRTGSPGEDARRGGLPRRGRGPARPRLGPWPADRPAVPTPTPAPLLSPWAQGGAHAVRERQRRRGKPGRRPLGSRVRLCRRRSRAARLRRDPRRGCGPRAGGAPGRPPRPSSRGAGRAPTPHRGDPRRTSRSPSS